ncbi:MAG: hypothetical protein ACLFU8_02830 [Anaerolineales bacterium]
MESWNWDRILTIGLIAMGASLVLALLLLLLTYRRLKDLRIPPGADFFTTLRHVPLSLVLFLDLLDFSLDFLSVPIGYAVLKSVGLEQLVLVTAAEALIPGTQIIPTLTLAWIVARLGVRLPNPDEYRRYTRK